MKLYDQLINDCLDLLDGQPGSRLKLGEGWTDVGECNLIMRGEMAYELGGGNLPAVSGFALTSSEQFIENDEVWLYGPDLQEIKGDTPYARLTFLKVAEEGFSEVDVAYASIRKLDYTRYHINPKGYMMRISVAGEREPVRVSHVALKEGLNLSKIGKLFLEGYHKDPKVLAVKMIFITLPDFPYEVLNEKIERIEKVTESLNHIFNNIKMDCSVCGFKNVCDEVDGLKELHFAQKQH